LHQFDNYKVERGRKSPLFIHMISKEKVLELIEERFNELNNGLFLVELAISKTNKIRVEIDKHQGGVSIQDCMSVSRNVEHNLDREEEDFEIEVTSAGLDKPLRVLPQFIKNIGREVEVAVKGADKVEGKLLSADEKGIQLEVTKTVKEGKKKVTVVETLDLKKEEITETKIVIKF
jgi:ribosome maturation factor RimP